MKKVYVLRHADWNLENSNLTEKGEKGCLNLKNKLNNFDIVISSQFERNKQTAKILTGSEPIVDKRAGILKTTKQQNDHITQLRQKHPLGVVGAIFDTPELIEPVKEAGHKLIELVKEILLKLPNQGKALVISHDGTMVSTEMILKDTFDKPNKTYNELEGYFIEDNLQIHQF